MNNQLTSNKGFTLIELMITVGVLAVVAAIAVPAYKGYVETGRLTEGWNNLNALNAAQQQFFVEDNTYFSGADATALNSNSRGLWVQSETTPNFAYSVSGASAAGYTACAQGTNNVATSVYLVCTITSGKTKCAKSTSCSAI